MQWLEEKKLKSVVRTVKKKKFLSLFDNKVSVERKKVGIAVKGPASLHWWAQSGCEMSEACCKLGDSGKIDNMDAELFFWS